MSPRDKIAWRVWQGLISHEFGLYLMGRTLADDDLYPRTAWGAILALADATRRVRDRASSKAAP